MGRQAAALRCEAFVSEEILPYQLAEFCGARRLPQRQAAASLKTLCTAVRGGMKRMTVDVGLNEGEQEFSRKLLARIGGNVERFLALAGELPRVRL